MDGGPSLDPYMYWSSIFYYSVFSDTITVAAVIAGAGLGIMWLNVSGTSFHPSGHRQRPRLADSSRFHLTRPSRPTPYM
jgi:hypothetical protein